jgi:pantoate kinase
VRIRDSSRQLTEVVINGRNSRAEVTRAAVRNLIGTEKIAVSVRTDLDLPVSQGFGMSAAGALSCTCALAELMGLERQRAFEAAHVAEIKCGSGLGDVPAIHRGGITVRKEPGLPPIGEVLRIDGAPEVVLGVVGRPIRTSSVLGSPSKMRAINRSGRRLVRELLRNPDIDALMRLSASFAFESGLVTRRMSQTMAAASRLGHCSMAMLGNSVFCVGDTKGLRIILSDFGKAYSCEVDLEGPRLL